MNTQTRKKKRGSVADLRRKKAECFFGSNGQGQIRLGAELGVRGFIAGISGAGACVFFFLFFFLLLGACTSTRAGLTSLDGF